MPADPTSSAAAIELLPNYVTDGHHVSFEYEADEVRYFTPNGDFLGGVVRSTAHPGRWVALDCDETAPDTVLYRDPDVYEADLRAAITAAPGDDA